MQKLYCYVDETGQDTWGVLFLVSVVITEEERDKIKEELFKIEQRSRKLAAKWHKTSQERRIQYLKEIVSRNIFKNQIFFSVYRKSQEYVDLTILTVAKAILKRASEEYAATVFVDGLARGERRKFASGLRNLKVKIKKVRGARDEGDPLIRLADAFAGFLRDYTEGKIYAKELYDSAVSARIISEI